MNANVIKKIAAPREVFPLSAVMTAFFDFAMSGTVLVGFMIWYQIPVGSALIWLPVLIGVTAILAFAVGMFLASLGTFKRDLIMAAPFLMQLWLFTSPIMYPLSQVPEKWRPLYIINPVVGLIEGYRHVLLKGSAPPMEPLFWSVFITGLVLVFAWPFYRWMSQYFADVV
jgi:lipopolysaccharide transport system permease protein